MKLIEKNELGEGYDTETGARVVLQRDVGGKYWSVFVKRPQDTKGKVIATRCTYEKAFEIAESI